MFELINNISELNFVEVVETIKKKEDWRDELIGAGLVNSGLSFRIPNSKAPLYLAIADENFRERFGNAPRVTIPKSAGLDQYFRAVCEQYNLKVIRNCGITIEGYDFLDNKTSQELVSFLGGFEKAYRILKAQH
jgi:hypothetical protein